jgi:hypothetical protein
MDGWMDGGCGLHKSAQPCSAGSIPNGIYRVGYSREKATVFFRLLFFYFFFVVLLFYFFFFVVVDVVVVLCLVVVVRFVEFTVGYIHTHIHTYIQ